MGLFERLGGKKSKDEQTACTLFGQRLKGKEPACHAGDSGDMGSILGREDPWRRKWQPTPVFLPGKSHGQRSLEGYSPWGHKELDMTEHELLDGAHSRNSTKGNYHVVLLMVKNLIGESLSKQQPQYSN